MRRFSLAILSALLVCGQLALADDKSDKDDLAKMKGAWTVDKVVSRGTEIPAEVISEAKATIDGSKLTITLTQAGESKKLVIALKLDSSKSPKEVDLTIEEGGPKPGEVGLGIYALDGELLTICHTEKKDDPRPTELKSEKGSQNTLMILKRAK